MRLTALIPTTLALAMASGLAACVEESQPPVDPVAANCPAEAFKHLIGQNKSALDGLKLPDPHRIIAPNSAVTMDFNPTRLNIHYDATGVITQVDCV